MIHYNWPAEKYHAHASLGSTTAKLALTSMQLLKDRLDGIDTVPDKPCFQVGRLAHMMVLEPERFAECTVVDGPINERTGKPYGRDTQAFQKWQADNPHLTVIEPYLTRMLQRMPPHIKDLLSSGMAERSILATSCGVGIKCRPDMALAEEDYDLKTIESFGAPDADDNFPAIESEIHRRGYAFSAGWYRMVQAADGMGWRPFHWIFAEKALPHRWLIVRASPDLVDWADAQAENVLTRIAEAQDTNNWYDDLPREQVVDVPGWLASDPTENADGSIDL
jgi:hypothetical protein